ncbi:hypothetical protein U1Q18_006420, partial [Sarracenia purpurea var. burkii]
NSNPGYHASQNLPLSWTSVNQPITGTASPSSSNLTNSSTGSPTPLQSPYPTPVNSPVNAHVNSLVNAPFHDAALVNSPVNAPFPAPVNAPFPIHVHIPSTTTCSSSQLANAHPMVTRAKVGATVAAKRRKKIINRTSPLAPRLTVSKLKLKKWRDLSVASMGEETLGS